MKFNMQPLGMCMHGVAHACHASTQETLPMNTPHAGAKVKIAGGANATVIPIPFATRTFADELPAEVAGPGAEARRQQAEAER